MEDDGGRTGRIDASLRQRILRAHELQPGELVGGRYRVEAHVGGGGMSDVYRARDERRGAEVALKVLRDEPPPQSGESFERRLGLLLRLDHPGLVRTLDVGEVGGRGYVVAELLDGETLKERLRAGGVSVAQAVRWILTVLDALEYLHGSGVVHRDVKPQNVMLTSSGPRLLDYGLARRLGIPEAEDAERLGTREYMAPEQLSGGNVDQRADLYACAAMLYEALTGRPPFTGEESASRSRTPPSFPAEVRESAPSELRRTVLAAMAIDPADRFATAGEMRAALAPFAEPSPAAPAAARARLRRRALERLGRRLERVGPALLALAALLAGAAAWWCAARDRVPPPTSAEALREGGPHVRMRESFRR